MTTAPFDQHDLLERVGHSLDAAREVRNAFLAEVPPRLDVLTRALAAEDAPAVRLVAHSIKGAAMDLGAKRLAGAAAAVEHAAQAGDFAAARAAAPSVAEAFVELADALRRAFPH